MLPWEARMSQGDQNEVTVLEGGCHCGNVEVRLFVTKPVAKMAARECGCTFCRGRRARWTSDPEGKVEISVASGDDLSRYRFGTKTADFLICRRCGYVVAAVNHEDETRAVVNIDVLERAAELPEAVPTDFDAESREQRLARRRRTWTPARVDVRG
jgi:hypothetical protein